MVVVDWGRRRGKEGEKEGGMEAGKDEGKERGREGEGKKEMGTHIKRAMQCEHTLVQEVGLLTVLASCGLWSIHSPATLNSLAPELLHNLLLPHKPVQL